MKSKHLFTNALWLFILLLIASACKKDPMRVNASAEEWVQAKKDTTLHFTSHTGEHEQIQLTFKKGTHTYTGFNGKRAYENYTLTYNGQQEHLGMVVLAENNYIAIRSSGQNEFDTFYASLLTSKKASDEQVVAHSVEAEILKSFDLNGRRYENVLRVKFYLPADRSDKLKELYYAKKHGLLYFQTTDGKYWTITP